MNFTKMHGCGNDYIYVDLAENPVADPAALSRRLSDRHCGIGGDGVITIGPSEIADFRMRIYNADGSEAEMCGNGIRCVGKYVYDKGLTRKTELSVETGAGLRTLRLAVAEDKVVSVTVDMGAPVLTAEAIPVVAEDSPVVALPVTVAGATYALTCVSMGNPHGVVFTDDPGKVDLPVTGRALETAPVFPHRANIEFVRVISRNEIALRVWERGSGETMACGTGACAAVMACILNGFTDDEVLVHLLGGDLSVRYDRETEHVFLTGGATEVFTGSVAS
ncbi:MAG: diaminopimelate epimerase [Clostridia bacterium]|nr:diaminopimelate epimerase [Clostridia bacterium]